MTFGGDADEDTSGQIFHQCREAGINFFDTANVYNQGRSEQILGKLIADCRDDIVLTTKVWGRVNDDINARGLSRRHIMLAVEDSLRRLGTDRIDLYFAHMTDLDTPIDETLHAFDNLVRQGKILYPAVSNWPAWRIAKALGISRQHDLARFECIQPMYNLIKRQAEVEILPMAKAEQVSVIPYNPLAGGVLTGKYRKSNKPKSARLIDMDNYARRYGLEGYDQITDRFIDYAQKCSVHPVTLAIAWVKSHPAVTAPILGSRSVEQLMPNLAAADYDMSEKQREEISALSIAPPPATDRSEEQSS
jgi:aryl-alcohol dehydrogenase-like predicted oxidoreductase